MSIIERTKRRAFLKLGMGGIATGAVAPHLWIPRVSKAALAIPADRHNHLIVLNLDGGGRSVPMFNAEVDGRWNPYGTQSGAVGTQWSIGGVFDADPYTETVPLGMPEVPSITAISNEIAVLATADHTPGANNGVGDHASARTIISTGSPTGGPGIISQVYAHHKNYTQGSAGLVFPPVVIGTGGATTPFGASAGTITPVMVPSFSEFADQSGDDGGSQPSWARAFEAGLDEHAAGSRSNRDRQRIERLSNGKQNVEAFKAVFTDPALKIATQPNGTRSGLTNAQLQAIFGTTTFGRNAALATRFVSYGSAAVLIGDNGWDTHSNEMSAYQTSANGVARVLCGLNYALKLMDHPEGGSYWDHTLICMISEFGRDNLMGNGYNSGGGSDHTGGPGSRYQAYAVTGGLVTQGGRLFGVTDPNTMEPLPNEPVFGTQAYEAMWLRVLDIDSEQIFPGTDPVDAVF
jgi:hypothetical protein